MTKQERAKLVDEYAELDRAIAPWKPKIARHKELRETITGWYDELPAADTFEAKGKKHTVRVSPREYQRRILSMGKVKAKLGLKRFLELCSFTLKHLDAHIPTSEQTALVTRERTGHRSLEIIPANRE